MMTAHTPGPWHHVQDIAGSRVVADGHGFSAPYRLPYGSGPCAQQIADNRLIAAAPELLAVCGAVVERGHYDTCGHMLSSKYECDCPVALARAAIAKATGGGDHG